MFSFLALGSYLYQWHPLPPTLLPSFSNSWARGVSYLGLHPTEHHVCNCHSGEEHHHSLNTQESQPSWASVCLSMNSYSRWQPPTQACQHLYCLLYLMSFSLTTERSSSMLAWLRCSSSTLVFHGVSPPAGHGFWLLCCHTQCTVLHCGPYPFLSYSDGIGCCGLRSGTDGPLAHPTQLASLL